MAKKVTCNFYNNTDLNYIAGFLEAISSTKDILTTSVGGCNQFFAIKRLKGEDLQTTLYRDIATKIQSDICYFFTQDRFDKAIKEFDIKSVQPLNFQEDEFINLVKKWTCDRVLADTHGKNGFFLSQRLFGMLASFFSDKGDFKFLSANQDMYNWPWTDQMSDNYFFITEDHVYVLHFGESS